MIKPFATRAYVLAVLLALGGCDAANQLRQARRPDATIPM
jgi:hypothetical protein